MTGTATQKSAPVTVTRGLKPSILSQKLHWIEGTYKPTFQVSLPQILSQKFTEGKAFNGYTIGEKYEDGRVHMTNPSRPDMGTHLVWSGTACDDCLIDPVELVIHLLWAGFKFTRLDLAIDAIDCNLRPQQATEEINLDRCKTRAKKAPTSSDARDKGYTQYVGKKTSEICLKLYDKAEELGIIADWTRVELTVRQKRANKAAWEIMRGTDFRRLVVAYADFPDWNEWRAIMDLSPVKLPKEQTIGNTEKWLLDSVAPALARVIFFAANTDFYEKFKDEVMNKLVEMSHKPHPLA